MTKTLKFTTVPYVFTSPFEEHPNQNEQMPAEDIELRITTLNRAFNSTVIVEAYNETALILNIGSGHGTFVSLHVQGPDSSCKEMYNSGFVRGVRAGEDAETAAVRKIEEYLHLALGALDGKLFE